MSAFLTSPNGLRRNGAVAARHAVKRRVTMGWLDWLAVTIQVITTRRQLAEMDDRMLKDIGISRGQAEIEAARAPWDIGLR